MIKYSVIVEGVEFKRDLSRKQAEILKYNLKKELGFSPLLVRSIL